MERRDNWKLDTEAHLAARRAAQIQFGGHARMKPGHEHEEIPDREEVPETEGGGRIKAPHTTFDHGQSSWNPRCRARPTAEECIDELHERFSS